MRGWIWAGPGRAGSGSNYRQDIWEHVGAQMAPAESRPPVLNTGPCSSVSQCGCVSMSVQGGMVAVAHFKRVNHGHWL